MCLWPAIVSSLLCDVAVALARVRGSRSGSDVHDQNLQGPQLQPEDCSCLHWTEVYTSRGVQCGAGRELDTIGGNQMFGTPASFLCRNAFEKLPGNTCMRMGFRGSDTTEWCYVSPSCSKGIPLRLASGIHWKTCRALEDHLLGERSPEQLAQMASFADVDLGLFVRFAYPTFQELTWPDVRDFFLNDGPPGSAAASARLSELQSVLTSGMPTVFESGTGQPPHTIVVGNRVYQTVFTTWMQQHMKDFNTHPGKMERLVCIRGCPSGPGGQLATFAGVPALPEGFEARPAPLGPANPAAYGARTEPLGPLDHT
eukprot:CAMPEP_0179222034 /NCGR_PEP_ID=MMETSP0797-20121207/6509_1 /TAXON_ID=47934 /ORGANISM="Dinophysis acuminata, Strain DAEP01" /LENGTH=312 /DNA_ID=CAMNT_0020928857 /DNA_START=40 /DNA_END=978 /DNA_ORIENTATION=+